VVAGAAGWWFSSRSSQTSEPVSAASQVSTQSAALSAKDVLNEVLGLARDNRWSEIPAKATALKTLSAMPTGNAQEAKALVDSAVPLHDSDPAKAEELLTRAVSLDPSFANARFELAHALYRQGKLESATATLIDGLVIGPDLGRGWLVAAEVFAETGKAEATVSALKLAVYYARNRDGAMEYLKNADQTVESDALRSAIKTALPSLAGVPKAR
jgi:predicted Zn-dependent protease